MKQVLLILVLIGAAAMSVFAQQWSCLYPNDTVYFINGTGQYRGLETTNIVVEPNRTKYIMYRTMLKDPECNASAASQVTYNSKFPIWAGFEVHQDTNGLFMFFNRSGQSITFDSNANLGDTWTFFEDSSGNAIYASVIAVDTATFLGSFFDSIKTILLLVPPSSNSQLNKWDSVRLQLTANHGMLNPPNFLEFPNKKELLVRTHRHPLQRRDVYKYDVGDYFQIMTTNTSFDIDNGSTGTTTYLTYVEVLEKVTYPSGRSVEYTFKKEYQRRGSNYTTAVSVDTVHETFNSLFDFWGSGLPQGVSAGNRLNVDFLADQSSGDIYSDRRNMTINLVEYNGGNDSCKTQDFYRELEEEVIAYECLGELTNSYGIGGSINEQVVCKNLCGVIYGNKLVWQPTGIELTIGADISIYPNPATDKIVINNKSTFRLGMRIFNLHGQLLADFVKLQQGEHVIPVYEYPVGLYVLEITGNGETVYQKIAIAR